MDTIPDELLSAILASMPYPVSLSLKLVCRRFNATMSTGGFRMQVVRGQYPDEYALYDLRSVRSQELKDIASRAKVIDGFVASLLKEFESPEVPGTLRNHVLLLDYLTSLNQGFSADNRMVILNILGQSSNASMLNILRYIIVKFYDTVYSRQFSPVTILVDTHLSMWDRPRGLTRVFGHTDTLTILKRHAFETALLLESDHRLTDMLASPTTLPSLEAAREYRLSLECLDHAKEVYRVRRQPHDNAQCYNCVQYSKTFRWRVLSLRYVLEEISDLGLHGNISGLFAYEAARDKKLYHLIDERLDSPAGGIYCSDDTDMRELGEFFRETVEMVKHGENLPRWYTDPTENPDIFVIPRS